MDADVDIGLPGLLCSSPSQTIPFLPIPASTPLEVPHNAVSNTMPPAVSTNPSALTFTKMQTKKLQLAHDQVLTYTQNDVPDRLALRLSKDIEQL
ncbi:hypothetical protein Moror_13436 [Moniliophthora roreri MCA 2997]|uniref:Uncharacterized protein n=1 Tax=Moniliophthora roreri (strain MCA 2997) TaxID=1381753 RepID=V2XRF4_MONRO|nr:hypothetical protein Moror_13436 [Moniliophthora roreri MCA 2997]